MRTTALSSIPLRTSRLCSLICEERPLSEPDAAMSHDVASFPSAHHVRAAAHVARLLSDRAPVAVCAARLAYAHYPSDGVFSIEDLIRGEDILVRARLFSEDDGVLSVASDADMALSQAADEDCIAILAALLATTRPLWLQMSTSTEALADALIPDHASGTLSELIPDCLLYTSDAADDL